MSIFVSFASEDRKYVDSFINESNNYKKIELWVSYKEKITSGINFKNLIEKAIDNSDGAILLISKNFLNSEFIIENELPRILEKKAQNPKYKVAFVLIDDCNFTNHEELKNIQLINSPSRPLSEAKIREYSDTVEDTFHFFKSLNKRNPLVPIITFGLAVSFIFFNSTILGVFFGGSSSPGDIRDCTDFATPKEAQEWFDLYYEEFGDIAKLDGDGDLKACESLNKGEEAFNNKINSQITEEDFGYLALITDKKYFEWGTWVCKAMDAGIPHYLIHTPLFYEMAFELQDLGAGGIEIEKLDFYRAVDYVIYASNNHLCETIYDTSFMNQNVSLMLYLTNGAEYNSDFYKNLFGGANHDPEVDDVTWLNDYEIELGYYLENPNENIPDKLYRGFAQVNDNINHLRDGCRLLEEYDSVETLLPFMQAVFDGAEDLEIQQIAIDTFQIQFEIIPQLYCQELEYLGVSASTWIYLVNFKFNPLLDA